MHLSRYYVYDFTYTAPNELIKDVEGILYINAGYDRKHARWYFFEIPANTDWPNQIDLKDLLETGLVTFMPDKNKLCITRHELKVTIYLKERRR